MDFDQHEYQRELDAARLDLGIFDWRPDLHPRGPGGIFRDKPNDIGSARKAFNERPPEFPASDPKIRDMPLTPVEHVDPFVTWDNGNMPPVRLEWELNTGDNGLDENDMDALEQALLTLPEEAWTHVEGNAVYRHPDALMGGPAFTYAWINDEWDEDFEDEMPESEFVPHWQIIEGPIGPWKTAKSIIGL